VLLVLVCLFASSGQASAQNPPVNSSSDVVFVADGAGNYQMASKSLRGVVAETNCPLRVETFVWSHGSKKIFTDQTDLAHARHQGLILAEKVWAYRQQHPTARIHLLGHSAGGMVVLSAAECLPPEAIDHIVLLLPSVSSSYDLRPALRSIKGRLQVHYSSQDWLYLGLCTRLIGCVDGNHCDAGGRVGFPVRIDSASDVALLQRLVQLPWQPAYRQLGNEGGHYGAYQPDYLKAIVLPTLVDSPR
jgi:pimeloyl-ACP methyl ester carboxylesterase